MTPNYLYKYINFESPSVKNTDEIFKAKMEKIKKCFENREIWYPKTSNLNDLFECLPCFYKFKYNEKNIEKAVSNLTDSEFHIIKKLLNIPNKDVLLEKLKTPRLLYNNKIKHRIKVPDKINEAFDYIHQVIFIELLKTLYLEKYRNIGILSLTENFLDLKMWAHYAGNSRGICLEFERNESNRLGSQSTQIVKYEKHRRKVSFHDRFDSKFFSSIIFTKSDIWQDETEWRDWVDIGNKAYSFPGKVTKVFFGLDCHDKTKELIADIFGNNIDYEDVVLDDDTFSIRSDQGIRHRISQIDLKRD